MNKEIILVVRRIMTMALEADGSTIFIEWAAHVRQIYVRFFTGQWRLDMNPDWCDNVFLDNPGALEQLKALEIRIRKNIEKNILKEAV